MHPMPRLILAALVGLALLPAAPALAQHHRPEGPHGFGPAPHRWGGDIHRFHDHDFDYWRTGRWIHGDHLGRFGWWWVADDSWYFYTTPVYPYPDPYIPSGVVIATAPAATPVYYYCAPAAAYYPYVAECPVPWQSVTGTAPTTVITQPAAPVVVPQQAPASPAPAQPLSQRDADDRQLNMFGEELTRIETRAPDASAKLKKLENDVEIFRKTLLKRDYNAMDILRDAEDLKERIQIQRAALHKK